MVHLLSHWIHSTFGCLSYFMVDIFHQSSEIWWLNVSHHLFNPLLQLFKVSSLPSTLIDLPFQMSPKPFDWAKLGAVGRIEILFDEVNIQLAKDINSRLSCMSRCKVEPEPVIAIRVVDVNEGSYYSSQHPLPVIFSIDILPGRENDNWWCTTWWNKHPNQKFGLIFFLPSVADAFIGTSGLRVVIAAVLMPI